MAKTISANTGGVTLSSANPADNPLLILAGVTVTGGSNGVSADASRRWNITNDGTVTGSAGIHFAGQGILANDGSIGGGTYGVKAAAAATITNRGGIAGAYGFGIYLSGGGKISNLGSAAQIQGAFRGVVANGAAATLTNQGTVSGTSSYAVDFAAGGTVTNSNAAARVTGGIHITGGLGAVTNRGTVSAAGNAINLGAGGTVANSAAAARIAGQTHGVAISGGAGTIENKGTISASQFDGVLLASGGAVTNLGTASHIIGQAIGIFTAGAATTVSNQGTIVGTNSYGIYLGAGGMVTNANAASLISGATKGIVFVGATGAGTVINRGTVAGTTAVQFGSGGGNLLEMFPGAVFAGAVNGGGGAGDTLELGSAASSGTISGLGGQFAGFEQITAETGATWQLAGTNTLASGVGLRIQDGAVVKVTGTLTAPGDLTIAGSGTLAAVNGTIEIGTSGAGARNQILVASGHTLSTRGVLSANQLKVEAGAHVVGAGTVSSRASNAGTIESKGGTLTIGGNLSGAGTLLANNGSRLALEGTANTAGSVTNRGNISLGAGDTLQVTGAVDPAGSGLFILDDASLLRLAADTGTSHRIQFLGAGGATLAVDSVGLFGTNVGLGSYDGPLLQDFGGAGDAIDLRDLVFAGATIDGYTLQGGVGLLQLHSGATLATLSFDNASLTGSGFQLANDGSGHVTLTHV